MVILFVYRAFNGFVILVRLIPFLEWEGWARIGHILTVLTSELLITGCSEEA